MSTESSPLSFQPSTENELREIALRQPIYLPCGYLNPTAVCMNEKGCRKWFLKAFHFATGQGSNDYYMT